MKSNKLLGITLLAIVFIFTKIGAVEAASDVTSKIYAEITPGELSMSIPNDLNFTTKLNGKKQSILTEGIRTKITDYRGIANGWQINVKSPNYLSYQQNYQILINNKFVSDSSVIVYRNNKQLITKSLVLPTSVELSSDANAGSYGADLEWSLQPVINEKIKE